MPPLNLALLPVHVARRVADAMLDAVTTPPSPEPVVVGGMPEGVPPAALRPEPKLPAPAGWPFGEEFPRTCGTGRFAGGAVFWTDFLYDDHGATGFPVDALIGTDPNRTVIAGYSMGGYGTYKLELAYPEVFAQAVVLAGPPVCGVRLLPRTDLQFGSATAATIGSVRRTRARLARRCGSVWDS